MSWDLWLGHRVVFGLGAVLSRRGQRYYFALLDTSNTVLTRSRTLKFNGAVRRLFSIV